MPDDATNSIPAPVTPEPEPTGDPTSRLTRRALALGALGTAVMSGGAVGAQSTKDQKKQAAKDTKAQKEADKSSKQSTKPTGDNPVFSLDNDTETATENGECTILIAGIGLLRNHTYQWEMVTENSVIDSGTGYTNSRGEWASPTVHISGFEYRHYLLEFRVRDGARIVATPSTACRIPEPG